MRVPEDSHASGAHKSTSPFRGCTAARKGWDQSSSWFHRRAVHRLSRICCQSGGWEETDRAWFWIICSLANFPTYTALRCPCPWFGWSTAENEQHGWKSIFALKSEHGGRRMLWGKQNAVPALLTFRWVTLRDDAGETDLSCAEVRRGEIKAQGDIKGNRLHKVSQLSDSHSSTSLGTLDLPASLP